MSLMFKESRFVLMVISAIGLTSCHKTGEHAVDIKAPPSSLALSSDALQDGKRMPLRYTEDGENKSPPLRWSDAPNGTKTFALVCEDPDAPSPKNPNPDPWVHWVLYNVPSETSELPEGLPRQAQLQNPPGAVQGLNSWPTDNVGYRGPAPPKGSGTHHYILRLFAVDRQLKPASKSVTRKVLLDEIRDHVLGEAKLTMTYDR